MILSTHAATGALIAALVPENPVLGISLGFASHFLLDMIPHWDYHLHSLEGREDPMRMRMPFNRFFIYDLAKIGGDILLGMIFGCIIFPMFFGYDLTLGIVLGAFAATVPDFLTFLYMKFPRGILLSVMNFHMKVHAKIRLHDWKAGAPLQVGMVCFFVFVFSLFR